MISISELGGTSAGFRSTSARGFRNNAQAMIVSRNIGQIVDQGNKFDVHATIVVAGGVAVPGFDIAGFRGGIADHDFELLEGDQLADEAAQNWEGCWMFDDEIESSGARKGIRGFGERLVEVHPLRAMLTEVVINGLV